MKSFQICLDLKWKVKWNPDSQALSCKKGTIKSTLAQKERFFTVSKNIFNLLMSKRWSRITRCQRIWSQIQFILTGTYSILLQRTFLMIEKSNLWYQFLCHLQNATARIRWWRKRYWSLRFRFWALENLKSACLGMFKECLCSFQSHLAPKETKDQRWISLLWAELNHLLLNLRDPKWIQFWKLLSPCHST